MTPLARGILMSGKLGAANFAKYFMSKFNPSYGVSVPDDNTLDLTNDFSGCDWVYPHNRNVSQRVMSKYETAGNQKSWHLSINTSGFLTFIHSVNGSAETFVISTIEVPLDTLTLVHFRLTGGTLFLGKNGASEQSTAKGACFSSSAPVEIGMLLGAVYSNNFDLTQPMLFNSGSSLANFATIYNEGMPCKFSLIDTAITDDAVMAFELSSNDTTVTDLSGTGNNGAFVGGSFVNGQPVTWKIGPSISFNNTLLLNGSNQYVGVSDAASLDVDQFSISFNTFVTTFNGGDWVSKFDSVGNNRSFIVKQTGSNIRFRISNDGIATAVTLDSSATLSTSTWYNIIVTYDGSNVRIYINNSLDNTASYSSGVFVGGSDLYIGSTNGSNPVAGSMTLPILFDSAIDSSDRAELQTAKQPEDYSSTLKAKYAMALPLNDGVVNPENDRSSNNNDGTLINSPTYTGETLEFSP